MRTHFVTNSNTLSVDATRCRIAACLAVVALLAGCRIDKAIATFNGRAVCVARNHAANSAIAILDRKVGNPVAANVEPAKVCAGVSLRNRAIFTAIETIVTLLVDVP